MEEMKDKINKSIQEMSAEFEASLNGEIEVDNNYQPISSNINPTNNLTDNSNTQNSKIDYSKFKEELFNEQSLEYTDLDNSMVNTNNNAFINNQPENIRNVNLNNLSDTNENKIVEKNLDTTNLIDTKEDFLNNFKVDLNDITVVDENPITSISNFNFLLNQKSKTQIVAIQSGYSAYVEGLNYNQINALTNSTLDEYALQLLLVQTIYESINNTSIGKPSFKDWCTLTSYFDLESFEYGMYLETFPGDTEFTVKCGSCGQIIPAKINNDRLICSKNEATTQRMNEILENRDNPTEILKDSFIHKKKRIFLEDSKIIIDIKLPTIQKHLDLLSSVNSKARAKTAHIFTLMIFFDNVLMLDVDKSMKTNKPCYYEVRNREKIASIIGKLSHKDSKHLAEQINSFVDQYSVQFKIASFHCPSCQTRIRDIPIEMEELLFFQIQR